MESANKTQEELMEEIEALREQVSELERHERDLRLALGNWGERMDRSFPVTSRMDEAVFVVFDRKLEFVSDRFAELFGVSPEEICSSKFDPLSLIAPESRRSVCEQYREACHGAFATKPFQFTGLTKNGLKMACETFLMFIPYKWGVAVHGTLRSLSTSRRVNEAMPQRHSDVRALFNALPTGVLYAERDRRLM